VKTCGRSGAVLEADTARPVGQLEEIAAPLVTLLSDAVSIITGVSLPIDGGCTCREAWLPADIRKFPCFVRRKTIGPKDVWTNELGLSVLAENPAEPIDEHAHARRELAIAWIED